MKKNKRSHHNNNQFHSSLEAEPSLFYFDINSVDFKNYLEQLGSDDKGHSLQKERDRIRITSHNGNSIFTFNEYRAKDNGPCLLYALGINYAQCFEDLINNKDNSIIKSILLREMYACFVDKEGLGSRLESISQDYQKTLENYLNARKDSLSNQSSEIIKEQFCEKHLENYLKAYGKNIAAGDPLWYSRVPLENINNLSTLPSTLIEAIAILYHINIEIYEPIISENKVQIKLVYRKILDKDAPVRRVLFVNKNHFNLLISRENINNNQCAAVQEHLFDHDCEVDVKKQAIKIKKEKMIKTYDDKVNMVSNNDFIEISDVQYQKIKCFMTFIGVNNFFETNNYDITLEIIKINLKKYLNYFSNPEIMESDYCFLKKIKCLYDEIQQKFPQELTTVFFQRELNEEWEKISSKINMSWIKSYQAGFDKQNNQAVPLVFFPSDEPFYVSMVKRFICHVSINLCTGNIYDLWKESDINRKKLIENKEISTNSKECENQITEYSTRPTAISVSKATKKQVSALRTVGFLRAPTLPLMITSSLNITNPFLDEQVGKKRKSKNQNGNIEPVKWQP